MGLLYKVRDLNYRLESFINNYSENGQEVYISRKIHLLPGSHPARWLSEKGGTGAKIAFFKPLQRGCPPWHENNCLILSEKNNEMNPGWGEFHVVIKN